VRGRETVSTAGGDNSKEKREDKTMSSIRQKAYTRRLARMYYNLRRTGGSSINVSEVDRFLQELTHLMNERRQGSLRKTA
jgi:hypothetical protein